MSLDLAIRQKLVRVLASSAICGLSISFIIGEAVDHKASLISKWEVQPQLLPVAYLPITPVSKTLEFAFSSKHKDYLVAQNSVTVPPADVPAPVPTFKDELRTILASTEKAPAPKANKTDTKEKMENVLLAIHDATAQLSGRKPANHPESTAVVSGGIIVKALPDGDATIEAEKVVLPVRRAENTQSPNPPAREKVLASEVTVGSGESVIMGSAIAENGDWSIRGRITFAKKEQASTSSGHFEVGLYSKIDDQGIPIGAPFTQAILPAGKADFQLNVPKEAPHGFLYAEFVAARTGKRSWIAPPVNPWTRDERQFAELTFNPEEKGQDKISTVSAAASAAKPERPQQKEIWKVKGTVSTLFERGQQIPQGDVVVKVRGRKLAVRTDKSGAFSLEMPRVKGSVFLELLKPGYHPTLVEVPADTDQTVSVSLASREAIERLAQTLGHRQLSSKGVFLGKAVGENGEPLRGLSLRMNEGAEGPYYFSEQGYPTKELKATSKDGRFLFLNIEPGTAYVEAFQNGETIAPFLLSTVEGGEMVMKTISLESGTVSGRIFNPVSDSKALQPVAGARVRVGGASEWSNTDSYGAFTVGPIRWVKGEKIALEFSAERFHNHRYIMNPGAKQGALNLYAFPATYLSRLARSMDLDLDSSAGMVIGKVDGIRVRIDALADHSVVNSARDFYFDGKGKLKGGSHAMTDPRFGTYVIFNVPRGRALLQGNDPNGQLRYSDSVVASPSSISIVMD